MGEKERWCVASVVWQVLDLRRALHAEPGSAEALRLASLRAEDVSAPPPPATTAPQHHTFDAVMQHHALRTHTETGLMHTYQHVFALCQLICASSFYYARFLAYMNGGFCTKNLIYFQHR